ncbi:efflux RND transporter periplasmic adaptor subunit [Patescibacteria group bacterium]|nr:efflux RND transporter periplasmic adaptor subunit [Patescibacteria group bacterium]
MKKVIYTLVIILIFATLVALGLFYFLGKNGEEKLDMTSVKAKSERIEKIIEVEGMVEAKKQEKLLFGGGDKVKEVKYKLGDEVKKDDVIIVFENDIELKAPFDGQIIELEAFEGQTPQNGASVPESSTPLSLTQTTAASSQSSQESLAIVADMNDLEYHINIDEDQIEEIKKEQEVKLECDVNKEIILDAEIETVGLLAQTDVDGGKYYPVIAKIKDLNGLEAREGMECDGEVIVEVRDKVVTVPDNTVLFDDSKTYVYIYNKTTGQAERKKVELGIEGIDTYEVTEGLEEGDEVLENAEQYVQK